MKKICIVALATLAASLILAPAASTQEGDVCYRGGGCFEDYYESQESTVQESHSTESPSSNDELAKVTVDPDYSEVTISQYGVGVVVPYEQFFNVAGGYAQSGDVEFLEVGAEEIADDAGIPEQVDLITDGLVEIAYQAVLAGGWESIPQILPVEASSTGETDPMAGESLTDEELAEYGVEPTQTQEDTVVKETVNNQAAPQSDREDESASLPVTGGAIAVAGTAILVAMLFGGVLFRKFSR